MRETGAIIQKCRMRSWVVLDEPITSMCVCGFRATTVRSKGRNLRIKAPMCRALKKLCDPDGGCVYLSVCTCMRNVCVYVFR